MSTADQLVRQLCELGESAEVSITKQKSGWFVAVRPHDMAPLWWCASKPTLELALQSCKDQAIELGLIPKEVDPEKEILKQTTLYMVSVSEFVEAGRLAREDFSGQVLDCTVFVNKYTSACDYKPSEREQKKAKFTVNDAMKLVELLFSSEKERKEALQKLGFADKVYPREALWALPTAWANLYKALHTAEQQYDLLAFMRKAYERSRKCDTET